MARERVRRERMVKIVAEKRAERDNGIRLHDGMVVEWLPKSKVQDNNDGTWTMPEWLAKEVGFL